MNKFIKIIAPKEIKDLEQYCNRSESIVRFCNGYEKDYCPKTCGYAERRLENE